jgi:hypothetical protein
MNLNTFKQTLQNSIGKEVFMANHVHTERTRKTKILHVQSNSFCFKGMKDEPETNIYKHSWQQFNKASNWLFKELAPGNFDAIYMESDKPVFTMEFRQP